MLENYQNAQLQTNSLTGTHLGNQRESNITWKPPMINQVKFNWDAAPNKQLNSTSLVMILKDFKGNILVSACYHEPT